MVVSKGYANQSLDVSASRNRQFINLLFWGLQFGFPVK